MRKGHSPPIHLSVQNIMGQLTITTKLNFYNIKMFAKNIHSIWGYDVAELVACLPRDLLMVQIKSLTCNNLELLVYSG
jgi:hypothetical protein